MGILKFQQELLILVIMHILFLYMVRMQLIQLLSGEDVKIVMHLLDLEEMKVLISVLDLFHIIHGDGIIILLLIMKLLVSLNNYMNISTDVMNKVSTLVHAEKLVKQLLMNVLTYLKLLILKNMIVLLADILMEMPKLVLVILHMLT